MSLRVLELPPEKEIEPVKGIVHALLTGPDGEVKYEKTLENLITLIGLQMLGERATGITSPPNQVSGGKLGTGTTAVAYTGAGAALVTYLSGTQVAVNSGYPQSSAPGSPSTGTRQIRWQFVWAAGVGTNTALAEAVIVNESTLTDATTAAANTLARVLLSPTINKGSSDQLTLTWDWQLG